MLQSGPLAGLILLPLGANLALGVLMALDFGYPIGPRALIGEVAFILLGVAPLGFLFGYHVRKFRRRPRYLRVVRQPDRSHSTLDTRRDRV